MKKKVLFVCEHNHARSVMAEAFLNRQCPADFHAVSAGFVPLPIHPGVLAAMREIGYDLSHFQPTRASDLVGLRFDFVITVSDVATAARCPQFPGPHHRLHWIFPNPATDEGNEAHKLALVREVRDAIQLKVAAWCAANCGKAGVLAMLTTLAA
jgi:arsenate reductase